MNEVKLCCNNCDIEWYQSVKHLSDITWICPECMKSDDVFSKEIIQDDVDDDPLVLGKGGCGKCG